jgi:hypothetical protein
MLTMKMQMITRSTLFLLPPAFDDHNRREYCPECAEIWGLIQYFPAIIETLDIQRQGIAHPRPALVALLGEGRWNCPTLVLASDAPDAEGVTTKSSNGVRYIDNARDIGRYFAVVLGTPVPRGS